MILPGRRWRRPRMTLGQILASIAVSALPLALITRAARGTERTVDLIAPILLGLCGTLLAEVFFWGLFVPAIPPLHRALGCPSWSLWELEVDPKGIAWMDDPPCPEEGSTREKGRGEGE
ncbi:MAG: hypothetical protein IRY99_28190, partial [Isosphaeraceae bacterium]|nr:hypothetical protein [Isosphaeraceae bacterium]